ncbi:ribonuclease H-like domain-containing protein [Tanacetum coccineum]
MTDLASLNYFLGISVTRDSSRMFLSERKYVAEILEWAHMVNCNPIRTPVDTESKLGDDGDLVSDSTLYNSLVDLELQLFLSSTTSLVAYSNADWAGCPTTQRSNSEYRGVANAVAETCQVRVLHVPSHYQYADIFTKGLPSALFEEFCTRRYGVSVPALTKDHEGNMINTPYPEKTNTPY